MINKKLTIILTIALLIFSFSYTVGAQTIPTATVIEVPQGYGYGASHSYTKWDEIRWGGECRRLINFAEEHNAISNNHGIVTYGSYFCGALTSTFGKVGDMMLVIEEGNIIYPVIMADTKSQSNKGCNAWGHQYGKCVVEFEILSSHRKSLYDINGKNSGIYISDVLAKPIVKVINLGSIWDNTYYLWNPKQACLDNGLEGYTLLTTPYGGEVVKKDEPRPEVVKAVLKAPLNRKKTNLSTINSLINWFSELIT